MPKHTTPKRTKTSEPSQTRIDHHFFASPQVIDVDLIPEAPPKREITSTPKVTAIQFAVPTTVKPPIYPDLSVDPVLYTPDTQPWPSTAPYSFLAHTLATLSQTRSRITIINTLTNALRTIIKYDSPSLLPAVYLLSNTLAPSYIPLELGLGSSLISRSIQHVSGLSPSSVKQLYNKTGDVGDVAFVAKSNLRTLVPHPPLLVTSVYKSLLNIAGCKGGGASKEKQRIVEKLLIAANGEEIRFLSRTLSQNLRVGAVRTSILTALSRAAVLVPISIINPELTSTQYHVSQFNHAAGKGKGKAGSYESDNEFRNKFQQAESLMKKVYVQHPNYEHIIAALLQTGLDGLSASVPLTMGIPLHPTLGFPTRSLDEIYDRLADRPFCAEFKYDGQRAQIHGLVNRIGTSIKIFSRHLEDMTDKYPDVVSIMKTIFQTSPNLVSFIMDAEIVAMDANGRLRPFQELSNRARKHVLLQDVHISVCIFAFDLMYLDGGSLLGRSFRERRALLRSNFPPLMPTETLAARFDHVESCESGLGRVYIEAFWEKALSSRCEGLMVKLLDNGPASYDDDSIVKSSRRKALPATYEPDKRTFAWLKLKKDYVHGLGDTLDLVPIGAWHGNGRKANWWSPILLGLWDPDSGKIVAVCKCMSGFTDVFYKALAERYRLSERSETCSERPLWQCDTGGFKPEVYFKPCEVWEIRGADITLSPVSIAAQGLTASARGLSLRFPRFLRIREDKLVEQASTPQFLASIWRTQQTTGNIGGEGDEGELIDPNIDASEEESEYEYEWEDEMKDEKGAATESY